MLKCSAYLIIKRERVVIQAAYREEEYKFYFSNEESVYFNISGEKSVIQTSFKRRECKLLKILL